MLNVKKITALIIMTLLLASCGGEQVKRNNHNGDGVNSEIQRGDGERGEGGKRENMSELSDEQKLEMEKMKIIVDKDQAGEELTEDEQLLLEEMKDKMPEGGRPGR